MNVRFIIFLLVVIAIVVTLVVIESDRKNPWDSDVFFSQIPNEPTYISFTAVEDT